MEYTDQCGRKIFIEASPRRIVSLVPSQTELLFDLGLEEEVVGITKFCIHPKKWYQQKRRIGGTKKLDLEKIRELNPDLIIANKEENTKEQIEVLEEAFPVWISDINNLEASFDMILRIGQLCGKHEKAKGIVDEIKVGFDNLKPFKRTISCLYFIWRNPYMVSSSRTFISSILERCGLANLAVELGDRYPEVTEEEIDKLKADIHLLSSEPYPFKDKHVKEMEKKFPGKKAILVDGEMFSWYGSRLRNSAEYLQNLQGKILAFAKQA